MNRRYTSKNGFTGVLSGKRSLSVHGPDGKEVLHARHTAVMDEAELKELVDGIPEFLAMMGCEDETERTGESGT